MAPITTSLPVASMTCPGCDCRMCASDAARAIEAVIHVRVDRFRGTFVVRHDPAVDVDVITACVSDAGLLPS